ncbi:MAG TPA: YCF48-related protein, partial [Thermoanaerobaculia bacterium]|nr:YCF48-related protein [Thermoanaerobaculia bacterium]
PLEAGSKEAPRGEPASYWLDLRGYHPPAVARELKQPFLILQGERDYQVTMEDYELWRKALADRKNVTFKAYPDLNHLFMEGKGKATPEEYGRPGHVAAGVVEDVAGWIKSPLAASAWRKHLTPATVDDLHNAFFVDDATGWVIAHSSGVVLHTADGGESWMVQAHLGPGFLESITFLDARRGWICGSEGRLFRTRDGGRTWERRSLGTDDVALYAVRFLDARRGFLAGVDTVRREGVLFETSDGGETWVLREDLPSAGFFADAMTFPTASAGLLAGSKAILATRNGGRTWEVALDPVAGIVRDLWFLDTRTGWAVGHHGFVLRTRDGGATWERRPAFTRNRLRSVLFVGERTGWAVGDANVEPGVLFETLDGGETWTKVETGAGDLHRLVESPGRVWAVGKGGVILSRVKRAGSAGSSS